MNKKILSLLVAGALLTGIGFNAVCLAAPHHKQRPAQHKVIKPQKRHAQFKKKAEKKHQKFVKKQNDHKKQFQSKKNQRPGWERPKNDRRPDMKNNHRSHRDNFRKAPDRNRKDFAPRRYGRR